ncbi:Dynein heavy chain, cytoplasmic [Cotesia glomerata]|uniref:Dynein heavy chain, cytoplasmic n=1 Tax=Cotesia glomerata TaxID=32391 RepID=A0AAV7IF96_COTGL|nr:Dynein heavy chain, cytoplasmic [Cotesia glomerata]
MDDIDGDVNPEWVENESSVSDDKKLLTLPSDERAGETTLSRFVTWINELSTFQVKIYNKYIAEDFDNDMRQVLRCSECKNEKIAFISDESNFFEYGFLTGMNTSLTNGEVPSLFKGGEYTILITQCKEVAQREGLMIDLNEDFYK